MFVCVTVLAWYQALPLPVIQLLGQCWGKGLGSRVDSSRANAGMLAHVLHAIKNCGQKWRVCYQPTGYGKSYCYTCTLLWGVFEWLRSTFKHHCRLSIDSADGGTDLYKTDALRWVAVTGGNHTCTVSTAAASLSTCSSISQSTHHCTLSWLNPRLCLFFG